MGLKVANNAFGTLNAGITSSDTAIILQAGEGARFPTLTAGDYFYATLIDTSNNLEIVKVTARSTDTMTVERGEDSTTARAFSTNDRFELRPTAALFNEKANDADVVATYLPKAGGTMTGALVTPMVVTDSSMNFRNRIINGDMRIDQRNAGAAVTLTAGGIYTVDRWQGVENTDGAMTAQQDSSAPTGFVTSVKCTTTTADGSLASSQNVQFRQAIEGLNVADLGWGTANAKTITLSFWVRSSLTGTFGGSLRNSAVNRSYPFTYAISVADTWEYKTVTIAGDTSGTWSTTTSTGITLTFSLGAGTDFSGTAGAWAGANNTSATGAVSVIGTLNATWYITGVQLEVGSVATPFERRPYGQELSLCQRYYEILRTDTAGVGVWGYNDTAGNTRGDWVFSVTKRAQASVGLVSGASWSNNTPTIYPGTDKAHFFRSGSSYYYSTSPTNDTANLYASAEL
jgi:hypothetical protein